MSDLLIQRGSVDVTNGNTTTITPVNSLNNAFALINGNRMQGAGPNNSGGNQSAADMGGAIEFTAVDTLTHRRTSDIGHHVYEVWEYVGSSGGPNEFIVRTREVVTVSGTTTVDTTISGVTDRNQCVAFITGINTTASGQVAYATTAAAYLTSNTNLRVEAQPGSGTTIVYVTVVEFTGTAWTVNYGTVTSGNDSGLIDLQRDSSGSGGATSAVTWANAFITGHCRAGDTSNVALADHWPRFQPNNATSCQFNYDGQHDGSHKLFVYVVENPTMNVTRFSNISTSHQGASAVNIAFANLTNINAAASFITRQSNGTGTAYGRNWVSGVITSLSSFEMWAHRTGNTLNTEIQIVDLANLATVGIVDVDGDNQFITGQQNIIINGFGFGATQGTGRVELWDDVSGTTRVTQTINSWSDSTISFNLVPGGITDNATRYIVVTTNASDVTPPKSVFYGIPPLDSYDTIVNALDADHRWRLNNDAYVDTGVSGVSRPMTNVVQGDGGSFEADPICEDVTHSWLCDGGAGRECADSTFINSDSETARTMGGWIRPNSVFQPLCAVYKEGGGVNNICFLIGMGNILIAQLADTGDDNVQVYSDFPLEAGRAYHIMFRFDYNGSRIFEMFIDGRSQSSSFGNPLIATDLDAHSGDVTFGYLDTNVEVFGTDVLFRPVVSMNYNEWVTWTRSLSDSNILDDLFRRGAIPNQILSSDTEANMQTALDALANTTIPNSPIGLRIEPVTNNVNPTLTANNVVFNENITEFVEWRGGGTLTWVNTNGSNLTEDKWFGSRGGSVIVVNPATLTLTGLQNPSEVRIYEAGTTTEIAGQENVTTGQFSTSIQTNAVDIVVFALQYQPVRLTNIDTSSGNVTLPIQQRFDRYYNNP
jgi:hypothetical protein